MWIPDEYRAPDDAAVQRLLASFGLADLVTATTDGPVATPIPFVHDPDAGTHGALRGHLARANPHWLADPIGPVLVMVRGADAYVSASWYETLGDHRVPTWNMIVAHVYGDLVVHDDREWCAANVAEIVEKHETIQGTHWPLEQADRDYVRGLLRDIVGVEVLITRIEAKFKLSQDKSLRDRDAVVRHLHASGAGALARAMEHNEHP